MTERVDDHGVICNLQARVNQLANDKHDLQEAIQHFIDKVDSGKASFSSSYSRFKAVLEKVR